MVDLARQNWREYEVDGVAASGKYKPQKSKLRQWGTWVEGVITAITSNGGLVYTTRASLYADLAHGANTSAWVVSDTTAAYNGVYQKSGISGAGSWTRVANLPYSFVAVTDTGAGTANALQMTSDVPTWQGALYIGNVYRANTGAATLSINGATARPLVTNDGAALASGYLTAGRHVLFVDDGTNWRLVSDVVSGAIVAAADAARVLAESAQGLAEDARDAAAASAAALANIQKTARIRDKAHAETLTYANIGDAALLTEPGSSNYWRQFKKVASAPSHAYKFQTSDGTWFEFDPDQIYHSSSFGLPIGDTAAVDRGAAVKAMLEFAAGRPVMLMPGYYLIDTMVDIDTSLFPLSSGSLFRESVKLVGSGKGLSRFKASVNNSPAFVIGNITGASGTAASGMVWRDIGIIGDAGATNPSGLQYDCQFNFEISQNEFSGLYDCLVNYYRGASSGDTNASAYGKIHSNYLQNFSNDGFRAEGAAAGQVALVLSDLWGNRISGAASSNTGVKLKGVKEVTVRGGGIIGGVARGIDVAYSTSANNERVYLEGIEIANFSRAGAIGVYWDSALNSESKRVRFAKNTGETMASGHKFPTSSGSKINIKMVQDQVNIIDTGAFTQWDADAGVSMADVTFERPYVTNWGPGSGVSMVANPTKFGRGFVINAVAGGGTVTPDLRPDKSPLQIINLTSAGTLGITLPEGEAQPGQRLTLVLNFASFQPTAAVTITNARVPTVPITTGRHTIDLVYETSGFASDWRAVGGWASATS